MNKNTLYLSTSDADLKIAAELLNTGKTVIFPTETVYGLGANALDETASEKIFSAKGRPSDNPLIVHIGNIDDLKPLVKEIPETAEKLIEKFWPGPLTIIFKKSDIVPKTVTGGLNTVAIRMPSHEVASNLLKLCNTPIAAPSANLSGKPSPTIFRHVKEDMDGRVDAIIDGGDCSVGVESTVLDVSEKTPVLYRPGGVTAEEIESLIGGIVIATEAKAGEAPKSPGLKYKHYSPNADVIILHGSKEDVIKYVNDENSNQKVGVLSFDEFFGFDEKVFVSSLGSNKCPEDAAHLLFTAMRELDAKDVDVIYAPEIPDSGMWRAVRNRLYRAAGENIIDVSKNCEKKIIVICTGNTCRSPMAEAIIKMKIEDAGCVAKVSSAGIFADGSPVSENSKIVMNEIGIDISSHKSRQLTKEMIENADLILTMTNGHKTTVLSAVPQAEGKVFTLAEYSGEDKDVIDPFGGSIEDYKFCRNEIERMADKCPWSEV